MPRVHVSADDWSTVYGVDLLVAEEVLSDPHQVQAWLDRFSLTFLSFLALGHGDKTVAQSMGRDQLSEHLVHRHFGHADKGRLRLAYLLDRYLWGRRQEALNKVSRIMPNFIGTVASLDGLQQSETHLVMAMEAVARKPQSLILYMLFDRAERVRYRSFSLVSGKGERVVERLDRLDGDAINRVLHRFYGNQDAARGVRHLWMEDGTFWLFILRRGKRESILTYEGYKHVVAADWIIAEVTSQATHLKIHAPDDEGVRIVEGIFYDLTGIPFVYQELS